MDLIMNIKLVLTLYSDIHQLTFLCLTQFAHYARSSLISFIKHYEEG